MKNLMVQNESASRPCWMLVDDDKDILSVLRETVAAFVDADVQCFHSPHAALAAFAFAPEEFDFVITDLEMPGMSGLELGERLRKLSPSLKVLLVTGSEILAEEEAAQKGFCGLCTSHFRSRLCEMHSWSPAFWKRRLKINQIFFRP
jgi:CheY-like chemotaxis protein